MSSWKSSRNIKKFINFKNRKPIGNSQSVLIKKPNSINELFVQKKIYNLDQSKQYKICIQIDDNLNKQKDISDMNELITAYEYFISTKRLSNGSSFLKKLRELRYYNQHDEQLDINLVDLMSRLIKFLSLFHDTAVEAFFDLFVQTKKEDLIKTIIPFYLMNFNKKYYDYI